MLLSLFDTKLSLRTCVNFEALKGTCVSGFVFFSSKALIHSFKANKDLLISAPSALRCLLLLWVSWALSEPAKSTKDNLPYSSSLPFFLIIILHIACDLDDVSFVTVLWVIRIAFAASIILCICSFESTCWVIKPYICTFPFLSSKTCNLFLLFKRSNNRPPYISKKLI